MIIESLKLQSVSNFEVVIADDGSCEDVVKVIEDLKNDLPFPLTHVWHEDLGWRKNIILNKAIIAASGDYLIFIDGDCIPHYKFIEEHCALATRGAIIGGRRVQLTDELSNKMSTDIIKRGKLLSNTILPLLCASIRGEVGQVDGILRIRSKWITRNIIKVKIKGLLGCNFSMYKSDILKVNGFDERFFNPATGEDTDLEARINRIGIYCHIYRHQITVFHKCHKRSEIENNANIQIYEENNRNNVSWTPYGIVKNTMD